MPGIGYIADESFDAKDNEATQRLAPAVNHYAPMLDTRGWVIWWKLEPQ